MRAKLGAALDAGEGAVRALLCRAGLAALEAWAQGQAPALAEWLRLRRAWDETATPLQALPPDLVATLVAHHGGIAA